MNGSILNSILVAMLICGILGLLAFLAGRNRPMTSTDRGRAVFRYRFLPRAFTIIAAIFLPTAITFLVNYFPPLREEKLYVVAAYLVIGFFCVSLLWEAAWFYVALDREGIMVRSAWRGRRTFRWDDVVEMTYSSLNMWFIFRLADGSKVRISSLVGNLNEFLRGVELQLPVDSLRHARTGYERLGRPFPALVNDPILEARAPR